LPVLVTAEMLGVPPEDRFPAGLRPGEGKVEYRNNINLRGLKALPVLFSP
jgi:hypothetical protein